MYGRQREPLVPRLGKRDKFAQGELWFDVSVLGAELFVTIWKAERLAAADVRGTSDPYVSVKIGVQEERRKRVFNTAMKPRTVNPVWNESFSIAVAELDEVVVLEVWDRDVLQDDFLGQVCV